MTTLDCAGTVVSRAEPPGYDDRCSCLQMDIGLVVAAAGWEPVQALGTGWSWYPSETVEPVEYFHPRSRKLGESLLRHHPAALEWHWPRMADQAHEEIVSALASGIRPIVAVDNYHLPFRPAFRDVHSGHLVVVEGYDRISQAYTVHDPMPPAFRGRLQQDELERARSSLNPNQGTENLFAGTAPARRWLKVEVLGPQPVLTWPWLSESLAADVAAARAGAGGGGPDGFRELLSTLPSRVAEDGRSALNDLYVAGWPAQAEAGLHSRLLARAAAVLDRPRLAEAARWVELVAGAWTPVRVSAGHGVYTADADRGAVLERVVSAGEDLLDRWGAALRRIDAALKTW